MSKQKPSGKKKTRHTVLITVAVILLLLLAIPIGYIIYAMNRTNFDNSADNDILINDGLVDSMEEESPSTGYSTYAIFGVDSRSNALNQDTRSDTIMLASINTETKDVKLASVYRDTYVDVPGHGRTKINHAYAYGGYSLALSTLNTNFDLQVRKYVTVNFYAVTKVIDLLGGIELDITSSELKWLNGYVREINRVNGTQVSGLSQPGTQLVNGTQALAYSRIRYTSGGDFKRTERQRIVFSKVFEKAKSAGVNQVIRIVNEMLPEISTNIPSRELLSLAKNLLNYNLVDNTGFPFEKTTAKINKVSYVIPIGFSENVKQLHEYLYGETEYTPSSAVEAHSSYLSSLGY